MKKILVTKHSAIVALCAGLLITPLTLSAQTTSDNAQGVTRVDQSASDREDNDYGWVGLLGLVGLVGLLRKNNHREHETTRTTAQR